MSDNIDIPITTSGEDGLDRISTALDRVNVSLDTLASSASSLGRLNSQMDALQAGMTSSLSALTSQIAEMKQVLATGFADISATNQKLIEGMGASQVRAIEETSTKSAAAWEAAGLRIKAADARTWEQIQRGSAANVTGAFAQMAEGIPVDAVLARYGELATGIAFSMNSSLESLKYYQGEMAAVTESGTDRQLKIDQAFATAQAAIEQQRSAARIMDFERESELETRWVSMLEAATEKKLELESLFDRTQVQLEQQRIAARIMDFERESEIETKWVAMLEASNEKKLELEAAFDRAQAAAAARRAATAAAQAEQGALKNASYTSSSPASQIQTQIRAVSLQAEGLDASQYVGAKAAADAQGKSVAALRAELAALRTTSIETGAAQFELEGALKQAEGAFRGAAHEAGIYGLAHGQLIALLAGGALAAALHHIAETGSEVEYALSTFPALAGAMKDQSIDMDSFIKLSSGTLINMKDAAEGMQALAEAGRTQQEALRMLPDLLRLASVGNMSVAESAELAVESMHAFGLSINDMGKIGDTLVAVASQSNVSVEKLAEDMKSAAVTGQMFGASMEETAATVGVLAERGLTIQPLSSALMKIYEPSAKGAAAIKQLGIEVRDASTGAFLPYTQVLDQLSAKMNEFSKSGGVDTFKAVGFSTRDIKAIQVMTDDIEGYHHILETAEGAQGLMFDAAARKADTATGAFKILSSTVQGEFAKAFEDSAPAIQQVEESLLRIVSSKDVQDFLTGMTTGFARLTQDILDNRGAIETMIVSYAALRVAPVALEALSAATVFLFGRTTVATAAIAAESATAAAGASALDLYAAGEVAAAAGATELAAAAGTAEIVLGGLATAARAALAVAGPLALVITGVSIAFDLFHGSMSKGEQDRLKMNNSLDSMIQSMDKEVERLKNLQEQMEKTGRTGQQSAYEVALAYAQMAESAAKADLDNAKRSATGPRQLEAGDDGTLTAFESNESAGSVTDAQKAYDAIHTKLEKLKQDHADIARLQTFEKEGNDIEALQKRIEKLHGEFQGLEAANPAAAASLHAQVEEMSKATVVKSNYTDLLAKEDALEKAIDANKRSGIKAPEKGTARADISGLQEDLRLAQMEAKSQIDDAKSQNKRGELGDLQLINREYAINVDLHKQAVTLAERELAIARASGNAGQIQGAKNRVRTAGKQLTLDDSTRDRATEDLFDKMDTQELQHRAKTLEAKGQLEDAFNLEWESKYKSTLANLDDDITNADSATTLIRLTRFKDFLEQMKEEGQKAAIFKMDVRQFDADVEHMATKLAELRGRVGPGTGLSTQVSNTFDQKHTLETAIPLQQADYAKAKADAGDDPEKLKQADSMLKKIQSEAAELNNVFVGLGQTIAQSLTDAFGKGGTALGGMVTAAAAYDAELKTIASTTTAGSAEAAEATAGAQIKAYGSMTGAAAGFFDQNSKGYKSLHAAEQAFRVFELGMAVANAVKKMTLETAVTAATVTNTAARTTAVVAGEEGAAAAAVSGAEIQVAADQVKGQSAAAVGVATQAQGEPYSAWARMAAMAAVMAGLGFAVSGGGGGSSTTAADRQAAQGTGTVLGSGDAKSESIAKAVELSAANSSTQINYLSGMLASLQAIQSGITSFASELVRSTSITSPEVDLAKNPGSWSKVFDPIANSVPVLGNITAKLATSIFGGKQSLTDSGFTINPTSLGSVMQGGVKGQSYADITTSGGWFSKDKTSTKTTALSDDADRQFGRVILSLGDSVKQAASILGASGDDFTKKLNGFVIDIGKVSLKGLSSDDIQKQLEAVFSKVGDQMASAAIPSLQQFQQVGEGYLQTLVRVASDYANVDASLTSISMAFGSVGIESVAAREDLITLSGGIAKFQSSTADFATNFLTKAQQQAPVLAFVNQQLTALNLGWVQTREQFAGVVTGLNLTTEAGRQTYSSLMGLESAFAATHSAIVDTSKTAQEVVDERKDLQSQLDNLTLSQIDLLKKQRDALDESNRALFDQVQAAKAVSQMLTDANTAMSAVDAAYTVLQNVTKVTTDSLNERIKVEQALNSAVQSALSGMADTATVEQTLADREAARIALSAAADQAQAGHMPTADSLKDTLATLKTDDSTKFTSYADYLKDQYDTKNSLTRLAKSSGDALSTDQAQLKSLSDMLAAAKEQTDVLKGISTTGLTIVQALQALTLSISMAQQNNPVVAATPAIAGAYQSYLGRAPDSAGMQFWQNSVASGTPVASVVNDIKTSTEATLDNLYQSVLGRAPDADGLAFWMKNYGAKMDDNEIADWKTAAQKELAAKGKPAFASGGFHAGGVRLVGENGPELEETGPSHILDATHTAQMLSGAGNSSASTAGVEDLLKELLVAVDNLQVYNSAENTAQVKQLQATVDLLQRVIYGGDAIQTKAVTP